MYRTRPPAKTEHFNMADALRSCWGSMQRAVVSEGRVLIISSD